jgi:hypothetical protein
VRHDLDAESLLVLHYIVLLPEDMVGRLHCSEKSRDGSSRVDAVLAFANNLSGKTSLYSFWLPK